MKKQTLSLMFALSFMLPPGAQAETTTISCLVAGYAVESAEEVKIFDHEFAADEALLAKKPRNADGTCVPQTIRSSRFEDEKKFGSLRISLHRCGPGEPYFYAHLILGTQSFGLTSHMEGLSQGVAVNVSNADHEEAVLTPYGAMSTIRVFCKRKGVATP